MPPDVAYFKPHPPGFGLRRDPCGSATLAPPCLRLFASKGRLIAAHDTDGTTVPYLAPTPDTGDTCPAPALTFSTQPKVTSCY